MHRFYLAAVMISIKFNEDHYYNNEYYSSVGGISCDEVNKLESVTLELLDFNLIIAVQKYHRYFLAMRQYYQTLMLPEVKKAKIDSSDSRSTQEDQDIIEGKCYSDR